VPPVRPSLIPRARLLQKLDQGLHLGAKLTLISAPAGFGKTTLITEVDGVAEHDAHAHKKYLQQAECEQPAYGRQPGR